MVTRPVLRTQAGIEIDATVHTAVNVRVSVDDFAEINGGDDTRIKLRLNNRSCVDTFVQVLVRYPDPDGCPTVIEDHSERIKARNTIRKTITVPVGLSDDAPDDSGTVGFGDVEPWRDQ